MTSDRLTREHFAPLVGQQFRVQAGADEPAVELELARLTPLPGHALRREPFALLFRGPKGLYLPQRIYQVEHERLGEQAIFLVPVQPGPDESLFEAIFN